MKICIIMSTYNGEKFIQDQIDSISRQTIEEDIQIYVRDDGSSDKTKEILRNYSSGQKRIRIILSEALNVGASDSFLAAVRECPEADIYAFSDQDDVWEADKLSVAVDALKKEKAPALWCSDYSVVDRDMSVITEKGMGTPCLDQYKVLFYNNVPGCVIVFNNALMTEIRKMKIEHVRMHDVMALNIAMITGKVLYSNVPYVKYRQHENNVLGYTHKKVKPDKWIREKIKLVIQKEPYDTSEYARELLRIWDSVMDSEQKNEYALIGNYRKSIVDRFKLLSRAYTKYDWGRTRLSIRCQILLGLI